MAEECMRAKVARVGVGFLGEVRTLTVSASLSDSTLSRRRTVPSASQSSDTRLPCHGEPIISE